MVEAGMTKSGFAKCLRAVIEDPKLLEDTFKTLEGIKK